MALTTNAENAYSAFRKRVGGRAWTELLEAERTDWEAVATAVFTDRAPYAWEIRQGVRIFFVSAQEFVKSSYDYGSFKPLFE